MTSALSAGGRETKLTEFLEGSIKLNDYDVINLPNITTPQSQLSNTDVSFYKVNMLSFDEEYPRREAFRNALLEIDDPAYNFVYILEGNRNGIELYLGVVKNSNLKSKNMETLNYGANLKSAFEGNFYGSSLTKVRGKDLEKLIGNCCEKYPSAGIVVGVPSADEKSEQNGSENFQGIDRLINSMLGCDWRIAVICEPVPKDEINSLQKEVYQIYDKLFLCSKMNFQQQANESRGNSNTISHNRSENNSQSTNSSTSRSKGISDSAGENIQSRSTNHSTSSNRSDTEGSSYTNSQGTSDGISSGKTQTEGTSTSLSFEMINKKAQEVMSYIDDELLERIKSGYSKRFFKSSVYYMAENPVVAARLKNFIIALFQGSGSSFSPLAPREISEELLKNTSLLYTYQNVEEINLSCPQEIATLYSRPYSNGMIGLNTYLTAEEVSLIAGLPQKEVPGIVLRKAVNFGLNQKDLSDGNKIMLGNIIQKGRILESCPFYIDEKSLSKHTFIAGVTGSGKTTTCHKLLKESKKPFLVIEPAKTEYRTLIKTDANIVVFTVGNETTAPFRLNPFELIPGEIISSHIDMIKATFTSAFPMEGSMPQLLEEAIIKVYEDKGWDISLNCNKRFGEHAFDKDADSFPILSDLLAAMEEVVREKNFGSRLGSEYLGSLVSRLSNLTKGAKGYMLNCSHSVDFDYIADNNVIIEMEELRAPEDKALIMGFVLTRMSAVIKSIHKKNNSYTHLTLIEEAHRLLSKPDYGDSGSKKNAVETFADMLAEVRKYGEGLIIVDQIPNKLASEVIKNTNTKIIHKILAKDDKETVGDAMLMDDEQKEYLSALPVGQAVIFTENTDKPVNVMIKKTTDTSEAEIDDIEVKKRFEEKKKEFGEFAYVAPEFVEISKLLRREIVPNLCTMKSDTEKLKKILGIVDSAADKYGKTKESVITDVVKFHLHQFGISDNNGFSEKARVLENYLLLGFEGIKDSDIPEIVSIKASYL